MANPNNTGIPEQLAGDFERVTAEPYRQQETPQQYGDGATVYHAMDGANDAPVQQAEAPQQAKAKVPGPPSP